MNKSILVLSIVVTGAISFWAGKNTTHSTEHKQETSLKAEAAAEQALVQKLQQLEQENNQLRTALNQAPKKSKTLHVPETKPVAVANSSDEAAANQASIDAIKAEYELKERSQEFNNWLTKQQEEKPWFDLGVEMQGRFEEEEKNYSWAAEEENQIQSLFSQEQSLAGIALKSTSCKSSQCQLKVSVLDQEHANKTAMAISQALSSHQFTQVIVDSQVKQGEAILYVTRNKKGFELSK